MAAGIDPCRIERQAQFGDARIGKARRSARIDLDAAPRPDHAQEDAQRMRPPGRWSGLAAFAHERLRGEAPACLGLKDVGAGNVGEPRSRIVHPPSPPGFSPVLISRTPSASARRVRAEPRRSGFCWLSCGAQPESQMISNVARTLPSESEKRSA